MILRSFNFAILLLVATISYSQVDKPNKKRKVYRTQTGSIIEAPKPLFERPVIQSKPRKSNKTSKKNRNKTFKKNRN
jgi:hypothetical protein